MSQDISLQMIVTIFWYPPQAILHHKLMNLTTINAHFKTIQSFSQTEYEVSYLSLASKYNCHSDRHCQYPQFLKKYHPLNISLANKNPGEPLHPLHR